jgi:chromosome segregation protein
MLKSLEVSGFKSFADRTRFDFHAGVTCVVGPNGSGKSNVVDAIKWILGDQSPKSLRGKEMTDVIFNGSASRKPAGLAEATLTFDNSQGLFPIDATEVQIGRRLFRSGDSEYLLNRNVVRLKDLKDLFLGTGAGTAAYSIIEQGRVEQILQANPTTRRVVFEEAAGISRFKSRRIEAEKRLEKVAQNLSRLRDIVAVAEEQWQLTKSQAGKATKYRELSRELERLWTGLAADDYRALQALLAERTQQATTARNELEAVREARSIVEQQRRELEQELSRIEDQVQSLQKLIAVEREAVASLDVTLGHQGARRQELNHELTRLRQEQARLNARTRLAARELETSLERLELLNRDFLRLSGEVGQREAELQQLRQQLQDRRQLVQQRRQQLHTARKSQQSQQEQLAAARSQLDALIQSEAEAQHRLEQAEQQLQQGQQERLKRQQTLATCEAACRAAREQLEREQSARGQLSGQHAQAETRLHELRERRTTAAARLHVLEELEQRQEGIAIGVREILRRAQAAHYPPWNSVLGLVRDLLEVGLEWAPVLEVALGERAQLIAVSSLQPLLTYLNRGAAPIDGRVGFVELNAAESIGNANNIDFRNRPGVMGRADEFVQEHPRAPGLAQRMLADTWVVDNLTVASQLAAEAQGQGRFVTLQGELLAAGQLYLGAYPHESSIISRKSELRQLRNELHQLDRGIEACTERQQVLEQNITSLDDRLDAAAEAVQAALQQVSEAAAQLTAQDREVRRLEQLFADQIRQVEHLFSRRETLESKVRQLEEAIQSEHKQLELQEQQLAGEEAETLEMEQLLADVQTSIRQEQLELAKHEERVRGLKENQQRLSADQLTRQQQLRAVQEQLHRSLQAIDRLEMDSLQAGQQLARRFLQIEQLTSRFREFGTARDQLRTTRRQLAQTEEALEAERRQHAEQLHAAEMELRDAQLRLQTLAQRIEEEFQCSLDELVARGVSAYEDFLHQRAAELAQDETLSTVPPPPPLLRDPSGV